MCISLIKVPDPWSLAVLDFELEFELELVFLLRLQASTAKTKRPAASQAGWCFILRFSEWLALNTKKSGHRCQGGSERTEDIASITGSQQIFTGSFRMGHQAKYVARTIADAGNIITRAVWICRCGGVPLRVTITEDDPVI